jgi:hypothetical protein
MKNLKTGMKCLWLQLPNCKKKCGQNFFCTSTFNNVTVVDIHCDGKYVKLRGMIAYSGNIHSNWYLIRDVFRLNGEDVFEKRKYV